MKVLRLKNIAQWLHHSLTERRYNYLLAEGSSN